MNSSEKIRGISKTSLWAAWKSVRKDLRNSSLRDVIDYLEYDVDPDVWISRLLRDVEAGTYEPSVPIRFTLGKSTGFSRTMTLPVIPDLVLFRNICDSVYRRAERFQQPHVYFLRGQAPVGPDPGATNLQPQAQESPPAYGRLAKRSFLNWLRFDQYRKLLIMNRIHPFIVTTDITNFFDSVLHSQVEMALRQFKVVPRMVGILFFLLERLAIRHPYGDSPRIGLPVDEFDCSRTLAHVVLFSHDARITRLVGPGRYVRWMDDQTIGVDSKAKGLRVLAAVGASLSKLHLTPNAKKSRILSLAEARNHFHFDANHQLDAVERDFQNKVSKTTVRKKLRRAWRKALPLEGNGEWDKVLKRFYRLAGIYKMRFLKMRALRDILAAPTSVQRILAYVRSTSRPGEYFDFVSRVAAHPEQVYPDVNLAILESCLSRVLKNSVFGTANAL